MTPEELANLAEQAMSLKSNAAFEYASKEMRRARLAELVAADATNTDEIRRLQSEIKAIDGLLTGLALLIERRPRKPVAVA